MTTWLAKFGEAWFTGPVLDILPLTASITLYVMSAVAAGHVLIVKRDPRSMLGWIVICLGFPGWGVLAYLLFGINRIQTRARDWQIRDKWGLKHRPEKLARIVFDPRRDDPPFGGEVYRSLAQLSESVTRRPLVKGCRVGVYHNGEEAYPAMLDAIASARKSVYLCTYIFENNKSGAQFAEVLATAARRGADVRVIVDGFGVLYSFPTVYSRLKKLGVRAVKFLPPSISKRSIHLNLRNHRKILAVDRRIGFTGGMNIGDLHYVNRIQRKRKVFDFQFRVEGPVVAQMEEAFFEDWRFVTGELPPDQITYDTEPVGQAVCRGITAGPNEDFEKLRCIINGAFACAERHIRIMTPYFIPDMAMVSSIISAKLKGVEIEIILPLVNNLPYVGWASQAYLDEFLKYDIKIYYRPSWFAHSKLMIVDDFYLMIGSANLDPRSLRLNFEFNMEVYDKKIARTMIAHFEEVKQASRRMTVERLRERRLAVKLRDGLCKLFSPYL